MNNTTETFSVLSYSSSVKTMLNPPLMGGLLKCRLFKCGVTVLTDVESEKRFCCLHIFNNNLCTGAEQESSLLLLQYNTHKKNRVMVIS